ncbi:TetR/AcrR family transcriptional regulator [Marinitenerispora sediminis]|uniref:TetR family transcriptional regulator n=1 Tax=Marinitenerispora sediminis TaxID=1931232 RepID=A0A368TC68_9ACTN|nr:TetR/AcrR family transcriptional regulator [Marinitenerispora sediminis]RCV52355.1 TetR family transcriptional regulator [Marinitenerispora sediminis]RCV60920.1 TetR family transcriptional regulator [Marinitenerispora sediminis]RCV62211.1 TetR family transcriptional regulator [Marinitenerispora sediminis]
MSYDAEATRRRILEAAIAEFAAHGLAGARVERIASAARANKQAIYLYFGGKEQLFGTVVQAKVDEICHTGAFTPDFVAETVGQLFDWYQENPDLVRLVLWEALETRGSTVHGEEERRAMYRAKVRSYVEAGAGAEVPEPERTRAVQDWVFTILGLVAWNFAVPQLCRLVLDEDDEAAALARRREAVVAAALALVADTRQAPASAPLPP